MIYMLVRHKVEDYSKWKRVFESRSAAQQQAGLRVKHVLRNILEPNQLFLFFEADTLERAQEFVNGPGVAAAHTDAGVVDEPDIYFLR